MKNKSTVKSILGYLKKYWLLIILSLILAFSSVVLSLSIPILIGDGIDLIIEEKNVDFEGVGSILIKIIIITLTVGVLQWMMNG